MTSERIKELFFEAAELPLGERSAFLDAACAGDENARRQVDALLAAHDEAGEFLAEPATVDAERSAFPHSALQPEAPGTRIDRYIIEGVLGEGGFGTVYLALQEEPMRRRVALKLLKPGMDSREIVRRFEAERQTLAVMDHPCIARVFDAGATEQGRPFFVMEYVDGEPLTTYSDLARLPVRERLLLFEQVCQAVQHAHQKGIIHRDLKPNNVLVGAVDGEPIPKVIDFGIAKALEPDEHHATAMTHVAQVIGTPQYMSPEQAAPGMANVDTRTDVYSLGALLYELLCGTPPLDDEQVRGVGPATIERLIRDTEAPRPSGRIELLGERGERIARQRQTEPRRLERALRGDLDWIIMRAIEKDPSRRYPTANAFAADIRRYLNGEAVEAGPPTFSYRFSKFARRNRVGLSAGTAVALAIIVGLLLAVTGLVEARHQHKQAVRSQREAEAVTDFLSDIFAAADPQRAGGSEVTVRSALEEAAKVLDEGSLAEEPLIEARVRATLGRILQGLGLFDEAEAQIHRSLEMRREHLGERHADVAASLNYLGSIARERGDEPAAERHLRAALEIAGEHGDATLELQSQLMNNLSLLLRHKGEMREAADLLARAVALDRRLLEPNDPALAATLNNLALLERDLGNPQRAETLWRETLQILTSRYGEEHMYVAAVLESLGSLDVEMERYEKAADLYKQALEIRRNVLGDEHPHVAVSLNNLGFLYSSKGDYDQALAYYSEALDLRKRVLGEDHPGVATALSNLGQLHEARGDLTQAQAAYAASLEIRRRRLGDEDPRTVRMWNAAARTRLHLGDQIGAAELFDELIDVVRLAADAEDASIVSLRQAAQLLLDCEVETLRDASTALRYIQRACAASGRQDPDVLAELSRAQERSGDVPGALFSLEAALDLLATDDPRRGQLLDRQATLNAEQQQD